MFNNQNAFSAIVVGSLIFLYNVLFAQTIIEPKVSEKKGKNLIALNAHLYPPKVDGYLSDRIWQQAQAMGEFITSPLQAITPWEGFDLDDNRMRQDYDRSRRVSVLPQATTSGPVAVVNIDGKDKKFLLDEYDSTAGSTSSSSPRAPTPRSASPAPPIWRLSSP